MNEKSPQRNTELFLDRLQIFIRRSEQPVIAGLIVLSFACIGVFYWHQSTIQDGIIDIDEAVPHKISFGADINAAEWPELANLPGIGEKLAKSIIQHRIQHGPFESPDSLTDVDGIGPNKLKKIRPFLVPMNSSPIADRPTE